MASSAAESKDEVCYACVYNILPSYSFCHYVATKLFLRK